MTVFFTLGAVSILLFSLSIPGAPSESSSIIRIFIHEYDILGDNLKIMLLLTKIIDFLGSV